VIFVSLHGSNLGKDLFPGDLAALGVLTDDAGADLNLVANLQNSLKNGTTSDTSLEGVSIFSGLVDIEGTNDDHNRRSDEISERNRDAADVVYDDVNVILELSRDRNNWSLFSNGTRNELLDIIILLLSNSLLPHDQVDLVLNYNDVLKFHDFNGSQVLTGLRLRARLVTSNQKQSRIHDGSTGKHSGHQNIVTWAINE
jgi:hypothetical protein